VDENVHLGRELFGEPCSQRCGSSPRWNAVYDAAQIKLLPASAKKGLLMLTDGFDSGSTHTWSDAAVAIHKAGASFYAIRYQGRYGSTVVPDLLPLIGETGGILFRRPNGDYRKIVSCIQSDLPHRYGISFRPDQTTGRGRHEIRVEVTRPDLTVRSRKTYFEDGQ
jgi:hypothetical protein